AQAEARRLAAEARPTLSQVRDAVLAYERAVSSFAAAEALWETGSERTRTEIRAAQAKLHQLNRRVPGRPVPSQADVAAAEAELLRLRREARPLASSPVELAREVERLRDAIPRLMHSAGIKAVRMNE